MITAQEARKIVETTLSDKATNQLKKVEECINKAVKEGNFSTFFYEYLNPQVAKVLKEKGFSYKGFSDPRGEVTVTILW